MVDALYRHTYMYTYAHLGIFPTDIRVLCKGPRSFKGLYKAPIQRGLDKAPIQRGFYRHIHTHTFWSFPYRYGGELQSLYTGIELNVKIHIKSHVC